jgi:hypothetical protein
VREGWGCGKTSRNIPIDPDLLDTAGKITKEIVKSVLREVSGRNTGDKESVGLHRFCVNTIDEMLLAGNNKVSHLLLDVVENPGYNST